MGLTISISKYVEVIECGESGRYCDACNKTIHQGVLHLNIAPRDPIDNIVMFNHYLSFHLLCFIKIDSEKEMMKTVGMSGKPCPYCGEKISNDNFYYLKRRVVLHPKCLKEIQEIIKTDKKLRKILIIEEL